ncbi:MAG: acetyl-CoA hydrolase/transferase C-terminal domain-containing protein [Thermoanaerobaculia bacterium]|nr:acetyl-CoA hydrolase/transferase C-terminal domain-containing protein [Thermoanaerobaculia bacterium]
MTESSGHTDVGTATEALLERVGPRVRLGLPLGIGKPVALVNELYRRARDDSSLDVEIYSALSLAPPRWSSDLERRLVEPMAERIFGDVPELDYVTDLERDELPPNVRIHQFYLRPGDLLDSTAAQSAYIASNYTHVAEHVLKRGLNAVAQSVGRRQDGSESRYSLGSNPDLTLDLLPALAARRRSGKPAAFVGHVNREMPFMYGDGELTADDFDILVDDGRAEALFGPPNRPVGTADYLIGLYASALIPDGGTLQLGIGTMSDAVSAMLLLRQQENEAYRRAIRAAAADIAPLAEAIGGTGRFEQGLFANSEMLAEGFLHLYRAGILARGVYPDATLQRLIDEEGFDDEVSPELFRAMVSRRGLDRPLTPTEVDELRRLGLLAEEVAWKDGALVRPDGSSVAADPGEAKNLEAICRDFLGERLAGGQVAHFGFFLGPRAFYQGLRELDETERRRFNATRISWVNRLGEAFELQAAQRRRARFLNETMMVTALGAAVSDGLDDGRVVSGVGGQYNFVAMAHELPDARSVLLLKSTRESGGELTSNLRWSYGHATIPRHLKDLVVTEYGVADLRGKTDAEVVEAIAGVCDSRFQDDLVASAKRAGKLPQDFRLPDRFRRNRPERAATALEPLEQLDLCPRFPFGSDLTDEEVVLGRALRSLEALRRAPVRNRPSLAVLRSSIAPPAAAAPYLARMGLDRPSGWTQRLERRLVLLGLASIGAI